MCLLSLNFETCGWNKTELTPEANSIFATCQTSISLLCPVGLEFVHFSCICLFFASFFFLSSASFCRGFMTTFLFPFPPGLLRKAFPADTYPLFIQNINHENVTRSAFSFPIRPYTVFTYVPHKPHARELNGFLSEKSLLYYCVYMHYEIVDRRLKRPYRLHLVFGVSISFYVRWTVHHCDNWKIKNQLDATYYFIVLLVGSTCFGHYTAHHQELVTMMFITTLVVSFLVCCRLEVRCG